MGNFNFQNYQEKLTNQQLSVTDFKPIKPGGFGGGRKETKPVISISRNSISANSSATKILVRNGKFVEFMVHGGYLVMRVLSKKSDYSYSLNVDKNESSASTSAGAVLKLLQEQTDLVNLNLYRYRFLLKNDEENIFFLNLSDPYEKKKINR